MPDRPRPSHTLVGEWRSGTSRSQWIVLAVLLALVTVCFAISLPFYSVMPVSTYFVWLVVGMLLLKHRQLSVLVAYTVLGALTLAVVDGVQDGEFGSARASGMVALALGGALILYQSRLQRSGLPVPLGGAMLADLRDRLQRQGTVQHGHIHPAAFATLTGAHHRRKNADGAVLGAAGQVGDLHVGHGRAFAGQTGLVQHAGIAQVIQIMAGAVCIGAGLAVTGERGIDQLRVDGLKSVVATAQLTHDARAKGFQDHVSVFYQCLEPFHVVGLAKIQGQGLFAPVDDIEQFRGQFPGIIAAIRLLDLDYLGTQLGQGQGAEGAGQQPGQVKDLQAVQ